MTGAGAPEPRKDGGEDRGGLLEDTLGFNLRSLRTLVDLWVRPRRVMETIAARDRDSYTPPVRLFLALIGLQVAISFVWGGYGGILERSLAEIPEEQAETFAMVIGDDPQAFFSTYGNIAAVLHAPIVGLFTALSVFVLGRFGARRPFAVNLNLIFAALTAGSVVGIAFTGFLFAGSNPPTWSVFAITAAYFITLARGLPEDVARTGAGRVIKAAVIALTMLVLVMIGAAVMQAVAIIAAAMLA
ncbi:MAG: hypothetical protein ABL308_13865 [Oceanicaulis sp.]